MDLQLRVPHKPPSRSKVRVVSSKRWLRSDRPDADRFPGANRRAFKVLTTGLMASSFDETSCKCPRARSALSMPASYGSKNSLTHNNEFRELSEAIWKLETHRITTPMIAVYQPRIFSMTAAKCNRTATPNEHEHCRTPSTLRRGSSLRRMIASRLHRRALSHARATPTTPCGVNFSSKLAIVAEQPHVQ
jgi:hypothetical protein